MESGSLVQAAASITLGWIHFHELHISLRQTLRDDSFTFGGRRGWHEIGKPAGAILDGLGYAAGTQARLAVRIPDDWVMIHFALVPWELNLNHHKFLPVGCQ